MLLLDKADVAEALRDADVMAGAIEATERVLRDLADEDQLRGPAVNPSRDAGAQTIPLMGAGSRHRAARWTSQHRGSPTAIGPGVCAYKVLFDE